MPEYPHHVTQRGSRRQQTFFSDDDYAAYLDLLAERLPKAGVDVWAYCLMPNHVHLVLVPRRKDSLTRLLRDTHATYARRINQVHGWQGHLWQERFHSFVMDERHLLSAVRYIELNPVRAGLCKHPDEWPWSSVHFHLQRRADKLMTMGAIQDYIDEWHRYIAESIPDADIEALRQHSSTGWPVGNHQFISKLEALTGRRLVRREPGPPGRRERASLSL